MSDDDINRKKDNFIPKLLAQYREREYWDERYKQEEGYEWLMSYNKNLKPLLIPFLKPTDRILILGCGNSGLGQDLYNDGYQNVVNIDYSEQVIQAMSKRTLESCPLMEWHVMNMTRLIFPDASFDVIIDKASLDAIWTDGSSVWDPSDAIKQDVKNIIDETLRTLKPGGVFISVSFGQPHFRLCLMKRDEGWDLKATPIDDTFYFLYTANKYKKDDSV